MASNDPSRDGEPGPAAPVRCRRTGDVFSIEVHRQCPYCFGKAEDIASGDHERFCDYREGEDPICFGFPPDGHRLNHG